MLDWFRTCFRNRQRRRVLHTVLAVAAIATVTISGYLLQSCLVQSLLPRETSGEQSAPGEQMPVFAASPAVNTAALWESTLMDKIKTKIKERVNVYQLRIAAISLAGISVVCLLGLAGFLLHRTLAETEVLDAQEQDYSSYFYSHQTAQASAEDSHEFYTSYFSSYNIPLPPLDMTNARALFYVKVDELSGSAQENVLLYNPQDSYLQLVKRLSAAEGQPMVLVPARLSEDQLYYLNKAEKSAMYLAMPVDTAAHLHNDVVEERFRATI